MFPLLSFDFHKKRWFFFKLNEWSFCELCSLALKKHKHGSAIHPGLFAGLLLKKQLLCHDKDHCVTHFHQSFWSHLQAHQQPIQLSVQFLKSCYLQLLLLLLYVRDSNVPSVDHRQHYVPAAHGYWQIDSIAVVEIALARGCSTCSMNTT